MAEGVTYICDNCGQAIEAWSDGNPYYYDKAGAKQYAYHPDHKRLDRCIGNDSPNLCLECGHEFLVDSLAPITRCPKCRKRKFTSIFLLDKQRCPYCNEGVFKADPNSYAIS